MSFSLIGKKFGRLTVIELAESRRSRRQWLCTCDCGRRTLTITNYLTSGRTRSCGCLQYEQRQINGSANCKWSTGSEQQRNRRQSFPKPAYRIIEMIMDYENVSYSVAYKQLKRIAKYV